MSFRISGISLGLALLITPAEAGMVETPDCRAALARADKLIHAIGLREKQFVAGDLPRNCRLLRQNLVDMTRARDPLDRCLTGHERGETVGQIDASIEDIRAVVADKCAP